VKDQTFGFDRIFDENVSQGDVYEATTRSLLDSVLDGYNATVFAYGATGCGKTHTITGTIQEPGIIFLTMQELFERIADRSGEKHTEISLSYLEIYNETIRDLLVPENTHGKGGLMLREDANQTVSVPGLTTHHPENVQEVMDVIVRGNELRTMSPTAANATSSRSHAVLQINLAQKDRNASVDEPHTMATLSIIDLAGSERASATKNRGERLIEGANINKSLLALGSCINALCDPRKRNHVPYRDSKLTRLLKFSLGGNCRTVMIVCVSPSSAHFDETQNTLRYANRAKNIQTKVTRNVYNVNRHVKDYLVKIDEQRARIDELTQQLKDYEAGAFAKFKKQNEKKEVVARESVVRLRTAYENSQAERLDKCTNMKKLRQIERRIGMISAWSSAFDGVCEAEENEDKKVLSNMSAMRKIAQGMLLELESSRHHYRQRLIKSNWERAIDSALQTGLRNLNDFESTGDDSDAANLNREAELLKTNAEREALVAVAEQEKGADFATVQVLLKAHFETMAAVQSLTAMDEESAVGAARKILGDIVTSCSRVTSHVVKPDAAIAPVEVFPPSKAGTPKRKQRPMMAGPSPAKFQDAPMLAIPPHMAGSPRASPIRLSPKRRKMGGSKHGVQFTPKKRSPTKAGKKALRWRDDTEAGTIADFSQTPQKIDVSPEVSSPLPVLPDLHPSVLPKAVMSGLDSSAPDSSPLQSPPHISAELKPMPKVGSSRFKSGFLSKKNNLSPSDGSPVPPTISINLNSSDAEPSPLRELKSFQSSDRASTSRKPSTSRADRNADSNDSSTASGSENESHGASRSSRPAKDTDEVRKIKSALKAKRASSINATSATNPTNPAARTQRRRSPTGSAAFTGSPPGEGAMFSASHARRMVRGMDGKDGLSVLSPRVSAGAVGKGIGGRRGTVSGSERDSSKEGRYAVRASVAGAGSVRSTWRGC